MLALSPASPKPWWRRWLLQHEQVYAIRVRGFFFVCYQPSTVRVLRVLRVCDVLCRHTTVICGVIHIAAFPRSQYVKSDYLRVDLTVWHFECASTVSALSSSQSVYYCVMPILGQKHIPPFSDSKEIRLISKLHYYSLLFTFFFIRQTVLVR